MPIARVDQIVAMVPEQLGITLDEALETSDELKQASTTPIAEVRELLDLARKIEGLARNVGTHAAAVVIADKPLDEYVPLQPREGQDRQSSPSGRWATSKRPACLKMDFLGLRNLTILLARPSS